MKPTVFGQEIYVRKRPSKLKRLFKKIEIGLKAGEKRIKQLLKLMKKQ